MDAGPRPEGGRQSLEVGDVGVLQVDPNVAAECSLLISEPALELGPAPGQLVQRSAHRAGLDRDLPLTVGGGAQYRRQMQGGGHATTAARTASTSGRWLARSSQESPSSRLQYTSPSLVPK